MVRAVYPYTVLSAAASLQGTLPLTALTASSISERKKQDYELEQNTHYYGVSEERDGVNNYRLNAISSDVHHRVPVVSHPFLPGDLNQTLMNAGNDINTWLHESFQPLAVKQLRTHIDNHPFGEPVQDTFLGSAIEGVVSVEQTLGLLWTMPQFTQDVTSVEQLLLKTVTTATGKHGFVNDFARVLPFSSLVGSVYRGSVPADMIELTEERGVTFWSLGSKQLSEYSRKQSESYWKKHVPCPAVYSLSAADHSSVRAFIGGPASETAFKLLNDYPYVTALDWTVFALCRQIAYRESGSASAELVTVAFADRSATLSASGLSGWTY
ncbi:MAG: hypothetical protein TR69_WS6001000236 [candidate division WS6 bacterium OLB20]|uniref:Uncharacterized protein n=1 Tax=candidate division WS6 bacterium OLB20 TaxID=1617426 RepID=A0A136M0C6_9BACT|nr:MAG: hypothetical protein TR69_WS6001000236 [candidate division WS6 bacterium OLB20]